MEKVKRHRQVFGGTLYLMTGDWNAHSPETDGMLTAAKVKLVVIPCGGQDLG